MLRWKKPTKRGVVKSYPVQLWIGNFGGWLPIEGHYQIAPYVRPTGKYFPGGYFPPFAISFEQRDQGRIIPGAADVEEAKKRAEEDFAQHETEALARQEHERLVGAHPRVPLEAEEKERKRMLAHRGKMVEKQRRKAELSGPRRRVARLKRNLLRYAC